MTTRAQATTPMLLRASLREIMNKLSMVATTRMGGKMEVCHRSNDSMDKW